MTGKLIVYCDGDHGTHRRQTIFIIGGERRPGRDYISQASLDELGELDHEGSWARVTLACRRCPRRPLLREKETLLPIFAKLITEGFDEISLAHLDLILSR